MCKVKTPSYQKPPEYQRERAPDNAAMYSEAKDRAELRGGGPRRSTILTGLKGTLTPPVLGAQTAQRMSTVLG